MLPDDEPLGQRTVDGDRAKAIPVEIEPIPGAAQIDGLPRRIVPHQQPLIGDAVLKFVG